jgi:hypothetical protein
MERVRVADADDSDGWAPLRYSAISMNATTDSRLPSNAHTILGTLTVDRRRGIFGHYRQRL